MTTFTLLVAALAAVSSAKTVRSPTPPMGWNSYNSFNCKPSEDKVKTTARGLVELGLVSLGYNFATVDCGWVQRNRDSQGRLQWDTTLFPSGGKALGDYLHGLGLDFGLYSGGGYFQCGSTDLPASLGYEETDAKSFAEWGGDMLKYDNCYSTSKTTMVDSESAEAKSPARFEKMYAALEATNRDFQYYICQWGIGTDVGAWASKIGNTWRISNDIYDGWRSIWRITNQVVPYYRYTGPGQFADMDMLTVGLGGLSAEEERFHFGMWAINKSPLIIGAVIDRNKLSNSALETLSNKEVIAINQDALAKQAQLVRRYTEEEWDIWLGDLSGSRKVLGIANWRNASQSVKVDFGQLGIGSAKARDVWAKKDIASVSGIQTLSLAAHELRIWVLSDITASTVPKSAGYYSAASAVPGGAASVTTCGGGQCLPIGRKVGNINQGATVTVSSVVSNSSGKKLVGVDFINYDYAFGTAWQWGANIRNGTIAVNGAKAKRWAFPLSGGNWFETGRLMVEVDGFKQGNNTIVFGNYGGNAYAPDLVGFEIFE